MLRPSSSFTAFDRYRLREVSGGINSLNAVYKLFFPCALPVIDMGENTYPSVAGVSFTLLVGGLTTFYSRYTGQRIPGTGSTGWS